MDQRARDYIAKISEFVLKEYEISAPIIDIDDVVCRLNGRILSIDDALVDSSVTPLYGEDKDFVIKVSSCQPDVRRRFSIAQQIGHLFLHMGYMSDDDIWENFNSQMALDNYTEKEFQAHEFASNFLMPQKQYFDFVSKYTKNDRIDAYIIANYFGVSESMASIRGKLIGALKWA